MPKSKRDKKISLTKTVKKGLQAKQKLVEEIRKSVGKFNHIFVFSVENMRNSKLKDLREEWKESRFFFGKNKVMALGLGKKKEDEIEDNLHKVTALLKGQCGLLFTNRSKTEVVEFFETFEEVEYARSGFVASETVKLEAGALSQFAHSLEPHLRTLGVPTALQKGVVTLLEDFRVCKKGKPITPQQASLLKLLGNQMAMFKVTLMCSWSKTGDFEVLYKPPVKEEPSTDKDKESDMEVTNGVEIIQD